MLCGCQGDRWPIRCLIVDEVERGFYKRGCFAPCLANLSATFFPSMFVWALTLRMAILWWEVFSIFVIWAIGGYVGGYIRRMGFSCG
jgi:hypothetical protein